jgi:hypothetical protein
MSPLRQRKGKMENGVFDVSLILSCALYVLVTFFNLVVGQIKQNATPPPPTKFEGFWRVMTV